MRVGWGGGGGWVGGVGGGYGGGWECMRTENQWLRCWKHLAEALDDETRDYATEKGFEPGELDVNGWALLHHAVADSAHRRLLLGVVKGIVAAEHGQLNAITKGVCRRGTRL